MTISVKGKIEKGSIRLPQRCVSLMVHRLS